MSLRRMLPFIFINIIVSAVVVVAILLWWDSRNAVDETAGGNATAATLATPLPGVTHVGGSGTAVASPAVTATPEVTPDAGPPIHVVTAGETLGTISDFYEVPLADIMQANDIANPNFISVGQQLIIPIGGIPTVTPAPTVTPVLLPSPIPTETPASDGEVIIQITDVVGAGSVTDEIVQITNFGSRQVALLGWTLTDASGQTFTFEQVTLFGDGAAIQIHTMTGQNGPADLYWGLADAVWESGETVTLRNADGLVINTYVVP